MDRKELLESLDKLKKGYISSINTLEIMMNWGRVQLESLYATKIGKYKIELLELNIQLKALKKKIQFCHQYINQNKEPAFDKIEAEVEAMIKKAYEEVHLEKQKIVMGKEFLKNLHSPTDSAEIRKIYRNIAKSLHPDINPHLTEYQKELWYIFHKAYKSGDLDRLKALEVAFSEDLKKSEEQNEELSEEEILLQTATLAQGIKELEEDIANLEKEFPFNIADQIRDEEWVEEQQEILKNEIDEIKKVIKEKEEIYKLIRETYE